MTQVDPNNSQFGNSDLLVQVGALCALSSIPAEVRDVSGSHFIRDLARGTRIESALAFLDMGGLLHLEDARIYANAIDEDRDSLILAASNSDAFVRMAKFVSNLGNDSPARRFYSLVGGSKL